jgi:hypothetical protein
MREASDRPEDTPTLRTSPLNLSLRMWMWAALGCLVLVTLLCLSPNGDLGLYRGGEAVLHAKFDLVWSRCMAGGPRVRPGSHFLAPTDSKPCPGASTCTRRNVAAKFRWIQGYSWPAGPLGGRAGQVSLHRLKVSSPVAPCALLKSIPTGLDPFGEKSGRPAHLCGATDSKSVLPWPARPRSGRAAYCGHRPTRSQLGLLPRVIGETLLPSLGTFREVSGRPGLE